MNIALPYGAESILTLRKNGRRPAEMVLVSLVGPLYGETNPVVIAKAVRQYDWRFLIDLEVLVVTNEIEDRHTIRQTIGALKAVSPSYLGLWFGDRQNGINFIVGGVHATPNGIYRYMFSEERQSFAGLGRRAEVLTCA